MNPVAKALWYINSHFEQDLHLEDVASCVGVSRFHLLRAFGNATGRSIMGYVRGLRLSRAARALSNGAGDILTVAIEAGYDSHEAFTRAFREEFGVTPDSVRRQGHLDNLSLTEPITMNPATLAPLDPPRFVDGHLLLLAGLAERCSSDDGGRQIPAQWQRFAPHLGHIPKQIGNVAYGVCYNFDETGNMDYLCAVEVSDFASLPREFTQLRVVPQRYAVFHHAGHISGIRSTWDAVWNGWLPKSGEEVADAPIFERYDENFDGRTGNGGVDLWIALRPK